MGANKKKVLNFALLAAIKTKNKIVNVIKNDNSFGVVIFFCIFVKKMIIMTDIEIHNGLENKELRDYLQRLTYEASFAKEPEIQHNEHLMKKK